MPQELEMCRPSACGHSRMIPALEVAGTTCRWARSGRRLVSQEAEPFGFIGQPKKPCVDRVKGSTGD